MQGEVQPAKGLRSVGSRMARPAESLAQGVAERVTELVVQALDVNGLVAKVEPNALLERVDVDALLERVDVDALIGRADVARIAQRIDIDALLQHTDLGSVIARSSGGVASGALDLLRSQAVGLDEFIARWVARLLRRRYEGPPGPPELLGMAAEQ